MSRNLLKTLKFIYIFILLEVFEFLFIIQYIISTFFPKRNIMFTIDSSSSKTANIHCLGVKKLQNLYLVRSKTAFMHNMLITEKKLKQNTISISTVYDGTLLTHIHTYIITMVLLP